MSGEGMTVRRLGWVEQRGWLAAWQFGVCILKMIPVHNLLYYYRCLQKKSGADRAILVQFSYRGYDLLLVPITLHS